MRPLGYSVNVTRDGCGDRDGRAHQRDPALLRDVVPFDDAPRSRRWLCSAVGIIGFAFAVSSCRDLSKKRIEIGATCAPEGRRRCSEDQLTVLICASGHLELESRCGGDGHCYAEGNDVWCDTSRGDVGDRCSGTLGACALDGKSQLSCEAGKLVLLASCGGPKGCWVQVRTGRNQIHCDGENDAADGGPMTPPVH